MFGWKRLARLTVPGESEQYSRGVRFVDMAARVLAGVPPLTGDPALDAEILRLHTMYHDMY